MHRPGSRSLNCSQLEERGQGRALFPQILLLATSRGRVWGALVRRCAAGVRCSTGLEQTLLEVAGASSLVNKVGAETEACGYLRTSVPGDFEGLLTCRAVSE